MAGWQDNLGLSEWLVVSAAAWASGRPGIQKKMYLVVPYKNVYVCV